LKILKIAAATAVLLVASACSTSSLTVSLNAIVVSADAALAVLGASGTIPAPVVALATNYLTAVSDATRLTAAELASADTDAVKASSITDIWAQAALPNLKDVSPAVSVAFRLGKPFSRSGHALLDQYRCTRAAYGTLRAPLSA